MSCYEISKSSLLSLKAEILRKEEDLSKAKVENNEKIRSINKKSLELKNKGVDKRQVNDISDEDPDLLRLSRSKLEIKSKLYDKLSKNTSTQSEETKRIFLVQFDKKEKDLEADEPPDLPEESDEDANNDEYDDNNVNSDDEWVEYTDSLGRSRKCLRKDLNYFKSQDADLKCLAEERHQTIPHVENTIIEDNEQIEEKPAEDKEKEMISGDVRREMLRQQWEKEEMELQDRTDIHYQNVLFDEARQHGVGYYAFSKDEEERAKQQEALRILRLETEREQKKSQDLKALREKQMAARMKAARNRKRLRLGLPPEEDEPEKPEVKEKPEETSAPDENETEKLLSEARKRHIRPWDIGKEGVQKSEFYQMTQHEWNEKKREERPKAFAPPSSYAKREFSGTKLEDTLESSNKSLKFSSKPNHESLQKRKLQNLNPYKNRDTSVNPVQELTETPKFQSVPIVNEVDTGDFDDALLADYCKTMQNDDGSEGVSEARDRGVEIPPPPTFDYFGPGEHGRKAQREAEGVINIEKSIEAGLKFLRNQLEGSNN